VLPLARILTTSSSKQTAERELIPTDPKTRHQFRILPGWCLGELIARIAAVANLVVWNVFHPAAAADEGLTGIFPIDPAHRVAVPAFHPAIISTSAHFRFGICRIHVSRGFFGPRGRLRFLSQVNFDSFGFLRHLLFSIVFVDLELTETFLGVSVCFYW
jgi:hypothetical protein